MKRSFLTIAIVTLMSLLGRAQLSEMLVESIEDIGENLSPEYDRTHTPMAAFEVVTNQPMRGLVIVDNSYAHAAPNKQNTTTHFYGSAVAAASLSAKYITLSHPDFQTLNIQLDKYPALYPLKGDRTYRITISVPSALLVEANKAFDQLMYDKAEELYGKITAPENERNIAQIRLASLPDLRDKLYEARKYEFSSEKANKVRAMIIYKDIYRQTKSTLARQRQMKLEKVLLPNKPRLDEKIGVSQLSVAKVEETTGMEAKTNQQIDRLDPSKPYYALIIVTMPLDSVKFSCDNALHNVFMSKGDYYVTMEPGEVGVNSLFVIHHRDCRDLGLRLKDYGLTELKSGVTYRISVNVPSLDVMEADRYFSVMDFGNAYPIYSRIDSLASQYSPDEVSLSRRRAEQCLAYGPLSDTWDDLRNEINAGGKLVDRREMCEKIDTFVGISDIFVGLGIPYASFAAESVKKMRVKYEKCYHLSLRVTGENGQMKTNRLYVEFRRGKTKTIEVARKLPGKNNEYRLFLPEELSDFVSDGGKVTFQVAEKLNDKGGIAGHKSLEQEIVKSGNNMNITYDMIIKNTVN